MKLYSYFNIYMHDSMIHIIYIYNIYIYAFFICVGETSSFLLFFGKTAEFGGFWEVFFFFRMVVSPEDVAPNEAEKLPTASFTP